MPSCPAFLLRVLRGPLACLLLWFGLAGALPGRAAAPVHRTVVVLYSISPDIPGFQEMCSAIRTTLEAGSPVPVDIFSEYTGLDRFSGSTYENSLLTLYQEKYAHRKVDLMILVGPSALSFAVNHQFLPGVPVVGCYVPAGDIRAAQARRPQLTGALPAQNAPRTLALMLDLFPGTRRIHVVLGASAYEREQAERGRSIFLPFAGRIEVDFLNNLSLEEMEARVATLPDTDLVLYGSLLQDASGREYGTNLALNRITRASRRPVFGVIGEDLGEGITGGVLLSMGLAGKASADLALRVMAGEPAGAIPPVPDTGAAPMFDARELKRHGIPERRLPPGSLVKYRKAGLWETYWKVISLALGIIGVETALVVGLVVQLRRRRRTEQALKEAEQRYRTVADFTHDCEFWVLPDGTLAYVSPACLRVTGFPPEAFKADPELLSRMVEPEDREAWEAYQTEALAGRENASFEYRIRLQTGEVRWVEQANNPVHLEGGTLAGSRGSLRDVTIRKRAEQDLVTAYQQIQTLKDRLEAENTYYREKIQDVEPSGQLLGQSDPMKYLLYRIRQVAPSETTVLIQGETGTGKELVAEAVHRLGPRSEKPLVKINCAALPPALAESELFGHERGAFTGAQSQRKGCFELADGATLFLDEVGELSPEIQAKLLRVLQDGAFQRVGGSRTLQVDVRVIAATNRDLAREVAGGRFREDLWYRLNVFPITVPPLRERPGDIPMLAQAFVARFCAKLGREPLPLPTSVVQSLQAYGWPGNVRELQNVMERAVLVSEGAGLRLADPLEGAPMGEVSGFLTLEGLEREHILKVLEAKAWRVEGAGGAAEILGLKPSTLRSRMLKLGIQRGGQPA